MAAEQEGGVISVAGGAAHMTTSEVRGLLTGLGAATAMHFYVYDGINLILVDMAGAFGASRDEASWIILVYSSAILIGTPFASYFARRIGLRRYFLGTIVLFVLASMLCSTAQNLEQILIFRGLEGLAAAGLNFWWRGGIYTIMPGPKRSPAMTHVSIMLYIGTTVGLIATGLLVDFASWRFVWIIDALFGGVAVVLLLRYFPRVDFHADFRGGPLDGVGMALLIIAFISIEVILGRGAIDDWFGSARLTVLGWIAIVALLIFAVRELHPRNTRPLLRIDLLRERDVVASVVLGIFTGVVLSGALYALPEYLRGIDPQRRSATQVGIVMCTYAVTAAIIRPHVAKVIGRFGQRVTVAVAMTCLIGSMLLMSRLLTTGTPAWYYIAPLVLYGFCLAPLLPAVGSGTAAKIDQARQIDAVSLYMTCRQLGTSLGVAIATITLDWRETLHSSRLYETINRGDAGLGGWSDIAARTLSGRDGISSAEVPRIALRLLQQQASAQAGALATADVFRVMAVIGLAAILFVPLMSLPPEQK